MANKYRDVTLRNVSQGYRGITTTSPSESEHSRTLDPGEVVTVSLTERELEEVMAAGDFELADAADASNARAADNADANAGADDASDDEIRGAILALDPDNDDHWTASGDPAVRAVAEMSGKAVTRESIAAAAPDAKRP